jgi:alpha-methylacyl-CoA racemase
VNLLDTGAPFYDVYPTSDGRHMAVGALEPQFYAEFVRLLEPGDDLPSQYDREGWPLLRERFTAAFPRRTQSAGGEVFAGSDACVAPVLSLAEAARHPQLAGRETFEERDGVVQPAPAPRFSGTPATLAGPPALPGEHTEQILADWAVDGIG